MESYPTEFTFHTSPLLFIAGLNPPPPPPSIKPNGTPSDSPVAPAQAPPAQPTDPFDILTTALRKTFASRKGFQLWDNSRGQNHDFHTLLVDKNLRFPPLKARPTSSSTSPPQQPPVALHSPISPLTPSSPLYPDGIIAPIWIRKHRELVPSVFILVLRLYESASTGGAPTDPTEREEEEREKDALLIREIIDRKRSTLERGIKLAVVLLCSRELLDDPALDLRLSLIRRQSGLDSRASLFVISPVPQSEVTNFVASIRSELWPAAIDYYREHGRRVRRKRARQPPKGGLSERGWNVRYDYKLALFAEMRGEVEVALKHYEDCYESLVDMFSQPKLLVARTKRWAEAKVLADCLTVKVAKLYLYLNDPSRSLSQLNRHVFCFRQLSESWSIGDETFEFWSWLSKQYRLFGDLTTAALRAGFRLPSLRPPPMPIPTPGVPQPPSPGLMPINVLQHPGHYYFLAAICALERRERYRSIKAALDEGSSEKPPEGALLHEGKVDHTEVIIELYTKAYEHFKHHGRRRTTYYLASLIASAHASSSPPNIDMALKFWDRIGRNYRKDGWAEIIEGMEEAVFECAKQGEKWVEAIKAGWDLLSPESNVSVDQRAQFAQELLAILKTHPPKSPEEATIQLESDLSPILISRLVFLRPKGIISTQIPFQLAISSPASGRVSGLTFDTLELHFNDAKPPITVRHSDNASLSSENVVRYELAGASEGLSANLNWNDGTTKVFAGTVSSDKAIDLTIEKIVLRVSLGRWNLAATLRLNELGSNVWYLDGQRTVSLDSATSSVCSIKPRALELSVDIKHAVPAYLGERYPIELEITNEDDIDVEIAFVGFVQPGEEGSQSRLSIDEHSSSSLLDSIPLGTLPSKQSLRKTVFLECFGSSGTRQLDLTVRSSASSRSVEDAAAPTSVESTHSLVVPCFSPFLDRFESRTYSKRRRLDPLLNLRTEPSEWAGAREGIISGQIKIRGPWPVEITSIEVEHEESLDARILSSSLDDLTDDLPIPLYPGDVFGTSFNFEVKPLLPGETHLSRMPCVAVSWRRLNTSHEPTTTLLPFPSVQRYPLLPLISLRLPSHMTLNTPTSLHYTLSNPTSRLLHLATQIDSAIQPSSFVFAGPRKIASLVLAPGEETTISARIVPLMTGEFAIPRFRVFEVEQVPTIQQLDKDGQPILPPPPRMRELDIEVETQPSREGKERESGELDLGRVGQEESDGRSRVLVLPDAGDLE